MRCIQHYFVLLFHLKIFQPFELKIFMLYLWSSVCIYCFRIHKIGCSMTDIFHYNKFIINRTEARGSLNKTFIRKSSDVVSSKIHFLDKIFIFIFDLKFSFKCGAKKIEEFWQCIFCMQKRNVSKSYTPRGDDESSASYYMAYGYFK